MGFGGGNDLFGYTDDGDGRLLNDGAKSYLWEMQGWLCGVTSAGNHYQYIYDAEGRLVTTASRPDAQCGLNTTTLADYIVDQFGRQITEADGSANWRHTSVYANGELLATYDGAGLHYALNDWLGDKRVQALASSTGTTVEETCWNLPFNDGFGCSGTGTDATEQHYTGEEHDKYASQLDHLGARSYTGYSARFLSPDPTQLYYADPANPQSFNLYSYGLNNPLVNVDPSGLSCITLTHDDGTSEQGDDGDGQGCAVAGIAGDQTVDPDKRDSVTVTPPPQGSDLDYDTRVASDRQWLIAQNPPPTGDPTLMLARAVAKDTAGFPDVCTVGAFYYYGKGVTALGAKGFVGGIVEYDSEAGKSGGSLVEAGAGTVGGGRVDTTHGTSYLVYNEMAEIPFGGSAGGLGYHDVGGRSGFGAYAEGEGAGREKGVGMYASVGTMGGCNHR
jgi:RHS repeat-associated protein